MQRHQVTRWLLCALVLGACSKKKDSTELVVTVWSDFAVPDEMDSLRLRVVGKERSIDHPFQLSANGQSGTYTIPVQLGLVPAGAKDGAISITAIGAFKATDMVWQQASLQFIPDQAHELVLYLAKACKNVECDEENSGLTCEKGACTRPVRMSTDRLPSYNEGQAPPPPSPEITGSTPDAAVADALAPAPDTARDSIRLDTPGAGSANLALSSTSADLGTVDVGATSEPVPITVTNTGTASSGALTVDISGAGIVASGCNGMTLAPQAACTISIYAKPAAVGALNATVSVSDVSSTPRVIAVTGMAAASGQFTLAPNTADFGKVGVGKSATATVTMTNSGTTTLTGIVIDVSGVGFTAGGGTCTDTLNAGQSCNIGIRFDGTASGPAKGTVTVSQGGAAKTVSLSATVMAAAKLTINPTSAPFQAIIGKASPPVTFYVVNSGDLPSGIPTVALSGANKADFSFTTDCVTVLPAGATSKCQVVVVYSPKAAGNASATLTVAEPGADSSSVTATLTGTAVLPSQLVISGTPMDFGAVIVGTSSAPLNFTVTNKGGEDSGKVQISATLGEFIIIADSCSDKALAPNAICTFGVQFKPGAGDVGAIAGQLKATGASTSNPAFLTVSGTAVPAAKLAINASILDFGSNPTLQESVPRTLTVSNIGGAPTGTLMVDNTGAQFLVKTDTCTGASLTASGTFSTCSVVVTFTPTGTSMEATGSIVVTDTTGSGGVVTASLHGTGATHPTLLLSPSIMCPQYAQDDPQCLPKQEVDRFADTVVGQASQEVPFTVTNMTDPNSAPDSGDLRFGLSGEASADFTIEMNNCTAPLISTSPSGTSCVLTLSFKPSAVGIRRAVLTLTSSRGVSQQTTLEGKGLSRA